VNQGRKGTRHHIVRVQVLDREVVDPFRLRAVSKSAR
jgi:hypothetical protein